MRRFPSPKAKGRTLFAEPGECDEQILQISPGRRLQRRRRAGHGIRDLGIDRKASQLCRQVAHALDEVLADCHDAVLQNLRVSSVVPCPDTSRLLVTVISIDDRPGMSVEPRTLLDHLENANGHLRYEVASAITRKRAPVLVYQVGEPESPITR